MARRLWARIVRDWENQPLAIIGQALSLVLALVLAVWGAPSAPQKLAVVQPLVDASFALALTVLAASIFASISRYVFRKSFIAGFCLSLVLASASILLFTIMGAPSLAKTSSLIRGSYDGPLMDVVYWAVFLIFVVVCCSAAINRMVVSSQALKSVRQDGEQVSGVTVLEILIALAIWGACLSAMQKKLVAAFVFQMPPSGLNVGK